MPRSPAEHLVVPLPSGALRLDALADGILRIRHVGASGDLAGDDSYALDPEPSWPGPTAWEPHEDADGMLATTAALAAHVAPDGGLTVTARETGEVLVDASGWPDEGIRHTLALDPEDRLFGLGDKAFGLDRRGHRVEMWNTDAYRYERGSDPLYKSIPFVLTQRPGAHVGLFYDVTHRSVFDLGASDPDVMTVEAEGAGLDLYVLWAPTPLGIVEAFARLTGRTPLLPKWALGYHQSRYSYRNEADVRAVARELRERRIPCDALYFDIHYMRGYRVFTWDEERFPDPAGLIGDLHADGFRSVVIVDPGVKADDPDYPIYADGRARDAFITLPDGTEVLGEVWPGTCAFPDFTSPAVRRWWGDLQADLVATGVDGIWNDMNEPALFREAFADTVERAGGETMEVEIDVGTIPLDARHDLDGRGGSHAEAHNVYGMQMLRSTFEGLQRLRPERRPFTITRAAYAGTQRYGIGWTGDNSSTWDQLRLAAETCLSLSISGMPVVGADVGGFSGTATGELLARWTQLGAVTPFFRNHSAIDTPRQEPWRFGPEVEAACRAAIELRMRLLPTLYTALWQAATHGTPILRPLPLAFPDQPAVWDESAFLVGDGLLAAPVFDEGDRTRTVSLPKVDGGWLELATGDRYARGKTVTVKAPLDALPLFVRAGTVLPLAPVRQHTGEPVDRLTLHVVAGAEGTSWLVEDAGDGAGPHWLGRFEMTDDGDRLRLSVRVEGAFVPERQGWDVVVYALDARPTAVRADGRPVEFEWDGALRLRVPVGASLEIDR